MAGPLVHWPLLLTPGNLRGPWFIPCGGIFHRELVNEPVRRVAREALDEMQLFTGPPKSGQVGEIRGVHHQRIALPMAHRIALIQADTWRDMRTPVGGDNTRGVVDLVKQ